MNQAVSSFFKKVITVLIRVYQLTVSPLFPPSCRHTPSCSEYAKEAVEKFGVINGLFLSVKRIGRCHPWGSHGYDPLKSKQ